MVEDSEPLGRMLAQTLNRARHEAQWAATGPAALDTASRLDPDVVLLDLHLADSSGVDLVAALRAVLPAVRLIGVSGEAPATEVAEQFDAFLLKPVALDTLLAAVTAQ